MVVHKDRAEIGMVDLLPKCVKCGCNVADSVEPEVERAAHLRLGVLLPYIVDILAS